MAAAVLQDIALDYQLLWNAKRQVAGVRLRVKVLPFRSIEASHLLAALCSIWHPKAPPLILHTNAPRLLADLLAQESISPLHLMIPADWFEDAALSKTVHQAAERGLQLLCYGQPGQTLLPIQAQGQLQQVIKLSPEQAIQALRVSLHLQHGAQPSAELHLRSPVSAQQIVDEVPSQVLVRHCLDEQAAAAVIAWPTEDVLYAQGQTRIQPDLANLHAVLQLIEADASLDQVEQQLGQDPVLAYRFLRYCNSAGLGLDRAIDSLRQGLMVMGLSRTGRWLRELEPQASQDRDLQPIRQSLALRARLMNHLLDAGESEALRRELYLCGLFCHIDWLLGDSMATALRALALPSRITQALLSQEGPYWPFMTIASAAESPYPDTLEELCARHSFDLEEVNLAVLRSLAELRPS